MSRRIASSALVRVLVLAISLPVLAACGGDDPTAPREVREREPVEVADAPDVPRDMATPSRGLPCDEQSGEVRACGAATDNYKASFNEDPDAPERRTWLAIHEVEVDGTRFAPVAGQELVVELVELEAADGRLATATLRSEAQVTFRVGPQQGLWGPLLTLERAPIRAGDDVAVDLVVTVDGDESVLELAYVRDETLATAGEDSLERGGPGGRWHVAGRPTATNLELGWE